MFPEPSSLPARDGRTNIVVRCGIHRTRCYGRPDVVQGERLVLTSFINITLGAVHSRSSAGAARETVPTVHRRAGQAVSGRHKPRSTVQEMLPVSPSSPRMRARTIPFSKPVHPSAPPAPHPHCFSSGCCIWPSYGPTALDMHAWPRCAGGTHGQDARRSHRIIAELRAAWASYSGSSVSSPCMGICILHLAGQRRHENSDLYEKTDKRSVKRYSSHRRIPVANVAMLKPI
ncbi:hypothetical protein B0H11DRAFT_1060979 [Mycena galericulata]|nr:hypothetical protein B0H11DRAFT_1060979 [Mycena galericulata]